MFGFLNSPIVQKDLDGIINKRTGELFIETDYMVKVGEEIMLCRYNVTVSRNAAGKYIISHESLSTKKATSKSEFMEKIFEVSNGELVFINEKKDDFSDVIISKKMLKSCMISCIFLNQI